MASSSSRPDPEQPATTSRRCGLLRRFMVMLYDGLVIVVLLMFATAVEMLLQFGNRTAGQDPIYTLFLFAVWFLYLAWCWRNGGMTLGMRAWRVRLATERTGPISWRNCVIRFLGGFLSALPLGLGYFWSLFDPERRAWHDRLSQSRLLRF